MSAVRILPVVLSDLDEAATWYDCNGYEGLGDRFIDAFYSSLGRIETHGGIYRMVYRDFRRLLIPSFPYFVYFASYGDEWIVLLVIHTSRRPELARSLLQRRDKPPI